MGIGVSVLLIAVGAVLTFAINTSIHHGFNIHTIGIILMAVGALGLIVDLAIFAPRRRYASRRMSSGAGVYPGRTYTEERVDQDVV
jgi:hypothetical protein